jgi:hypothetical protein
MCTSLCSAVAQTLSYAVQVDSLCRNIVNETNALVDKEQAAQTSPRVLPFGDVGSQPVSADQQMPGEGSHVCSSPVIAAASINTAGSGHVFQAPLLGSNCLQPPAPTVGSTHIGPSFLAQLKEQTRQLSQHNHRHATSLQSSQADQHGGHQGGLLAGLLSDAEAVTPGMTGSLQSPMAPSGICISEQQVQV